jgi:hypothetical protein
MQITTSLQNQDGSKRTPALRRAIGAVPGATTYVSGFPAINHDTQPLYNDDLARASRSTRWGPPEDPSAGGSEPAPRVRRGRIALLVAGQLRLRRAARPEPSLVSRFRNGCRPTRTAAASSSQARARQALARTPAGRPAREPARRRSGLPLQPDRQQGRCKHPAPPAGGAPLAVGPRSAPSPCGEHRRREPRGFRAEWSPDGLDDASVTTRRSRCRAATRRLSAERALDGSIRRPADPPRRRRAACWPVASAASWGRCRSRCPRYRRPSRCSSSTRPTSARPSTWRCWATGRPVSTTSRVTARSRPRGSGATLGSSRCRCRPGRLTRAVAEAVMRVPGKPAAFEWAEAATHPLVVDATRAKERLGWRPAYTSLEALRDTRSGPGSRPRRRPRRGPEDDRRAQERELERGVLDGGLGELQYSSDRGRSTR